MKFSILLFCLAVGLFSQMPALANNSEQAVLVAEAKQKTQAFATLLKSTLVAGLKQGGPVAGIEVCQQSASAIAQGQSLDGWQVGRTSDKVRNPKNQPDEWERKQLTHFAKQKAAGVDLNTLVFSEMITDENGQQNFRFIKAIPMGKPCLACHGEKITPEIQAKISQHYPQDKATGFKVGDIRGAFTLTKKL